MSKTARLLIGAAVRRLMLVGSLAAVLVVALAGPALAHPGHGRSGLEPPGARVAGLCAGRVGRTLVGADARDTGGGPGGAVLRLARPRRDRALLDRQPRALLHCPRGHAGHEHELHQRVQRRRGAALLR